MQGFADLAPNAVSGHRLRLHRRRSRVEYLPLVGRLPATGAAHGDRNAGECAAFAPHPAATTQKTTYQQGETMKLFEKINFRQPKYMLPAILYIPLLGEVSHTDTS